MDPVSPRDACEVTFFPSNKHLHPFFIYFYI